MADRFSKTTRVQHDVLNLIATGNIGVGGRIPPEKELARQLNASVITIQRALANLVSQDLIERVQGKGTFVKRNLTAAPMSHSLGFVLVNRSTLHYEHLMEDARNAAQRRNHSLTLISAGERPNDVVTRQLSDVSGVVMSGIVTDEWLEFMDMMHLPYVVVGTYKLKRQANQVRLDAKAAARMHVSAFRARGCRRIGLINGARTYLPSSEIYQGYREGLSAEGLPFDESWVVWCRKEHRLEDMGEFFSRNTEEFDGLVLEYGCFQPLHLFLYERGLSLPRTVLGVIFEESLLDEPLRRVQQVVFQDTLGEHAINQLFRSMNGGGAVTTELISPRLVATGPAG